MIIKKPIITLFFALFWLSAFVVSAQAASTSFSWLPNSESDLAGYKIYYGTSSHNYTVEIDVGLPAAVDGEVNASVDSLQEGQTYYFAAVAYSNTEESGFSTEVEYTVPLDTSSDPIDSQVYSILIPTVGGQNLELGEVEVNHASTRINFLSDYVEPVIIANTVTKNGADPVVVRISDVDSQGFTVQLQEYGYLDGYHCAETVNYFVMEKGSYTLWDGTQIEAGLFDTNATTFANFSFMEPFNLQPVVLTSITTLRGYAAVTGRLQNISRSGFDYKMQEQESNDLLHSLETVAYLAVTPGSGVSNGIRYQAGRSGDRVTDTPSFISFNQNFNDTPFQFSGMQTTDGGDTAAVRNILPYIDGMEVVVEEECSLDSETSHGTEVAGYFTLLPR